jgi:hypothetical protein
LVQCDPLQTIDERALMEEKLRAESRGAVAAQRAGMHVEQFGHRGACALALSKRQEVMVTFVLRAVPR